MPGTGGTAMNKTKIPVLSELTSISQCGVPDHMKKITV